MQAAHEIMYTMIARMVKAVPTTPNASEASNFHDASTDTMHEPTTEKITATCGVRWVRCTRPMIAGSDPDLPIENSTRLQLLVAAVADAVFELMSAKKIRTQPFDQYCLASSTQSFPPVFAWKAAMFISAPTFHA